MSIFDDAWDAATSIVSDAIAVVHLIPGVDAFGEQLKDFANSPIGMAFLRAASSSLMGGLSLYVSPQVASVAFALPGVAAGDPFIASWGQETLYRIKKTAEIAAPGALDAVSTVLAETEMVKQIGDQLAQVFHGLAEQLPQIQVALPGPIASVALPDFGRAAEQLAGKTLRDVANEFSVREDAAQMAIDALLGTHSFAVPAMPPIQVPWGTVPGHPGKAGKRFNATTGEEIAPGLPGRLEGASPPAPLGVSQPRAAALLSLPPPSPAPLPSAALTIIRNVQTAHQAQRAAAFAHKAAVTSAVKPLAMGLGLFLLTLLAVKKR